MPVTEVSARYMRRVQVRDYEPNEAEATIKAQVLDGEDADEVFGKCMSKARTVVHAALGLLPKPQGQAAATPPVGEGADEKAVSGPAAPEAEKKRGPGRPPKEKPAVDPAAMTDDAPAAVEEKPAADPASMDFTITDPKSTAVKITDLELNRAASEAAQRIGSPDPVKALMKNKYKITALGQLKDGERANFVADLGVLKAPEKK